MNERKLLISSLDNKPLFSINNYKFILNPLTEQVPATTSDLLKAAANILIEHMNIKKYNKILTEEDKGGILAAAVSLISGLPFGIARWYPNNLANQISSIFSSEYIYFCFCFRTNQF